MRADNTQDPLERYLNYLYMKNNGKEKENYSQTQLNR